MPTASKLVAALWFALLGWFAAELSKAHLPEGTQFGWYSYITGVIGLFVGWMFLGKRAGDTMRAAYGYGFTATILLLFWALLYFPARRCCTVLGPPVTKVRCRRLPGCLICSKTMRSRLSGLMSPRRF